MSPLSMCHYFLLLITKQEVVNSFHMALCALFNKWRSLECVLFCCKAHGNWVERERSIRTNTRCSQVFLSTSWVLWPHPNCFRTEQTTVKTFLFFHDEKSLKTPHAFLSILKAIFISRKKRESSAYCILL